MQAVSTLRRFVAVGLLGLMGASWPLWEGAVRLFGGPGTGESGLCVPFFQVCCGVPAVVDAVLLFALGLSLVVMLIASSSAMMTRVSSLAMVGSLGLLVLLDQLRLQPWVYQFLWLGTLLGLAPNRTGVRCIRWLVASLYLWSGVSKIDPLFVESHGQMLVEGLLKSLNVSTVFWPEALKRGLAWGMPVGEILVGLMLLSRRTMVWGLIGSLVMHGLLVCAFSARGLDHGWTVLGWNLSLIVLNLLLFRGDAAPSRQMSEVATGSGRCDRMAVVGVLIPLLCPLLNPWGYWDHWPSWSLYSSRPGGVEVFVSEGDVDRLPRSMQDFVLPPEMLSDWRRIRLEEWCFRVRGVPPVPEVRWKLAMAMAIGASLEGAENQVGGGNRRGVQGPIGVRVRMRHRSGWWSTEWDVVETVGVDKIREMCDRYWLNTRNR